jgi:hypothetical protein
MPEMKPQAAKPLKTPEDLAKDHEKNLANTFDAYVTVYKNQNNGKLPSMEDISKMLAQKSSPEAQASATPMATLSSGGRMMDPKGQTHQEVKGKNTTSENSLEKNTEDQENNDIMDGPRLIHMRVYYGMSGDGDQKQPDPNKIMYYESPKDKTWYDTVSQQWLGEAPHMAQHLQSRPITFSEKDIVAAIAHGVMGDDDYEALDKAKMLDDTPKRLWALTKKLKGLNEELSKSEESEKEDENDKEEKEKNSNQESKKEDDKKTSEQKGASKNTREAGRSAMDDSTWSDSSSSSGASSIGGGDYEEESRPDFSDSDGEGYAKGEDVVAAFLEAVKGSGEMDMQIRDIVRQELAALGFLLQADDEFTDYNSEDELND